MYIMKLCFTAKLFMEVELKPKKYNNLHLICEIPCSKDLYNCRLHYERMDTTKAVSHNQEGTEHVPLKIETDES
jgi:hypothetical protein